MIESYSLAVPPRSILPVFQTYKRDAQTCSSVFSWLVDRKVRPREEAPIFRRGLGTPDFNLAAWKNYSPAGGIVYERMAESFTNERLCIILASYVDVSCMEQDKPEPQSLRFRLTVEGAAYFFMAGFWQCAADAPEKCFAPLTRPSTPAMPKHMARQPWILDWDEWIEFLETPKNAKLRIPVKPDHRLICTRLR